MSSSGQTYRVLAHDGGYAYAAGATISETFPTHADALAAARLAARRQARPGDAATISFETAGDAGRLIPRALGTSPPASPETRP